MPEEGHIYSLATSGDLLYTGSDSKNIRIWKQHKEYSWFKSNSGLVKTIIIAREKIFTGHQDGKIRVWKVSYKNANHKRIGTLPMSKNYIKCSMKPSNYVEVGGKSKLVLWIKHFDSISCLSLSEDQTLLYSASWDKTFTVWRVSDFKCLESINAYDDAVNALVVGFDGLVFTASADGMVKIWRKELQGKGHTGPVKCLAVERNHDQLTSDENRWIVYSGSLDKSVKMWRVSEQALPMVPNEKHKHYTSDGYCVPMLSSAPSFASHGGEMGSRRF
ncbi:hypothetical protein ACFX12_027285 [Malus domestica]